MTTLSSARAPVQPNKLPGEAVEIHDGEIWMWMDGTFGPVRRSDAAGEALYLANSPFPASRRRAEAITNALRETRQ